MEDRKVKKGDRIRVVKKSDGFSEDYRIGEEFLVTGTWYGGVQTETALGIPVSLSEEEYELMGIDAKEEGSPVWNAEAIPEELVWREDSGLITRDLGEAAGSERIYVRTDTVPAGAYSTKYHSHSQMEEFFYILEGSGSLRWNGGTYDVKKGDFLAKPGGKGHAHTFYNSGNVPLVILDFGTAQQHDICYYPDEDVYLQKSGKERRVFRGNQALENWSSDPKGNGI